MSQARSPVCPDIGRTVLCILLFSGLCSCLHEYHLIRETKTWTKAQEYCREKYADLATVNDMDDMERLLAAAGSGYQGNVWIGLRYRPGNWKWSLSDPSFYGEGEQDFRMWSEGEPNSGRGRGKLCIFTRNGFWRDYACSSPRMFLCYDRNLNDRTTTSIDDYVFIQEKKTWDEAQAYCRKHHTDLASVRNNNENELIQLAIGDPQVDVSLGLYMEDSSWSDGASFTFNNWRNGSPRTPTETCVASVIKPSSHGKWVEGRCSRKRHFMCHAEPKKHVIHFKLTARTSAVDLNDPAVTEAILNLIKEKMEEKGFTRENFKTSWIKKPGKTIFHREEEKTDL